MGCEHPTQYDLEQMRRAVWWALGEFNRRDSYLLETWVDERAIAHRLAVYLERQLPNWHVDCEYNKYGDGPKLAEKPKRSKRLDIIVHRRGSEGPNLLAVEIKKMQRICVRDHEKLAIGVRDLRYHWALCLSMGRDGAKMEWQSPGLIMPIVDDVRWSDIEAAHG